MTDPSPPRNPIKGRANTALRGDDGRPLAVVEAKATRHDAGRGQQQAKLYADALEAMHGQRPVIFYSNGYEHWLWDDTRYPPRRVQGFYKKDELALLVQRRAALRPLRDAAPDEGMRAFLNQHQDHVAILKLRNDRQLTPTDLEELERMLRESGVGSVDDIERAKADAEGLGLFVRSLAGLDRAAARAAFGAFMSGRTLTGSQVEMVTMLVEHLTEHGVMDPSRLYESPFVDLSPVGVDDVFPADIVDALFSVLDEVRSRAAA